MNDSEFQQALRCYCAALQHREPPPEQLPAIARYVRMLNETALVRADEEPLLPDPASYREILRRYLG